MLDVPSKDLIVYYIAMNACKHPNYLPVEEEYEAFDENGKLIDDGEIALANRMVHLAYAVSDTWQRYGPTDYHVYEIAEPVAHWIIKRLVSGRSVTDEEVARYTYRLLNDEL